MTKRLLSFSAILMAIIVLCTSTGLSLHFHCCGGKVKSTSFLVQASDCFEISGLDQKSCRTAKTVPLTSDCTLNKPDCCTDKASHHIQQVEWWDVQDFQEVMVSAYSEPIFIHRKTNLHQTGSYTYISDPPPESVPLWLQYSIFLL